MIVRDISPEVFYIIRKDDFEHVFSYVRKSEIDRKFFGKHFFKSELLTWEANELSPYCKIFEDLGPLFEESNYRKIIMLN